jgi:Fe-S oxidoreductase
MSTAWMAAHGDVALDDAHGAPPWACTDCGGCTAACEHRNPVGRVLADARDALRAVAPAGASRVIAAFARHAARTKAAAGRLAAQVRRDDTERAPDERRDAALLIGCVYLRGAPAEARDAVRVVRVLTGATPFVIDGCCGLPLRLAGDQAAFAAHALAFARSVRGHERLFVLDPGCALTLKRHYRAEAGINVRPAPALLVESVSAATRARTHAATPGGAPRTTLEPVRWHDPCQLGRGLGVYDAPRDILARALGRPADEFVDRRAEAACSGAGGALPATMPGVARSIASARLDAHVRAGGGRLVTGCGASLLAMRRRAAGVPVDDLVSWMLRALG